MADSALPPGFEPRWQNPADYILSLNQEIWEDRGLAALQEYYASNLILRSPGSVLEGPGMVTAAALSTLAEFPDRQILSEDVIWCETPAGHGQPAGFHASHRQTSVATHRGRGIFGLPTGTRLRYRIMSDSWCAGNQVRDSWQIRDQGAILRQLDRDPKAWMSEIIAAEGGPDRCPLPLTPDTDIEGPYIGRGNEAGPGKVLSEILKSMMSGDFSVIPREYDRACELVYPGGMTEIGHEAADQFWLSLRSAFPSAAFRIEHATGMEEPGQAPRAALRWTLYGKHDGPGAFGSPTGVYVYVMGITHAEFGPRGLRREWTLIDETAIWKQILLSSG